MISSYSKLVLLVGLFISTQIYANQEKDTTSTDLTTSIININQESIQDKELNAIDEISKNLLFIENEKVLSDYAIKQGDLKEGVFFLKRYIHKKDSLNQLFQDLILEKNNSLSNFQNNYSRINEESLDDLQKSFTMGRATTALGIALITILTLFTVSLNKNNNIRARVNTLLKEKNTELQTSKDKAEKASLIKTQFLSTITHELRTPLYAVTGLTHLLLEENPNKNQKEHLNSLKFSGNHLLSLIDNILDFNKLEANKVEIEKRIFNLRQLVKDVIVTLKKSATDKSNKLHLDFDKAITDNLLGDPLTISQILINLVGNAIKFTQNGNIYISVKKIDQLNSNIVLRFEVEDNGIGISKKKQNSIFDNFTQESVQINRKYGGTGLGLSIVKNLLQLHNSEIVLESELGKGSKFMFEISFSLLIESFENPHDQETKAFQKIDFKALKDLKVLVVEDNKINQMISCKILEKHHMKCSIADNGEEAIKMVYDNDYNIILMDIHMPGISGIEAMKEIRKFNKTVPVLALTAVTIEDNIETFNQAGFNEIIPKPFKPEEFFNKIYRSLNFQN